MSRTGDLDRLVVLGSGQAQERVTTVLVRLLSLTGGPSIACHDRIVRPQPFREAICAVAPHSVKVVPGKRRPTAEDRSEVLRICLGGLAAGRDIFDLARYLAPLHPKNNTFPGEVLLDLAADALEETGATRDDPIPYENIRERYLPECEFRGKHDHRASHYALSAAAMIRAGVQPDLLGEVIWWPRDDFWLFALYALVIYVRLAGDRTGDGTAEVVRRIAARRQVQLRP